jgi:hypothetical protein
MVLIIKARIMVDARHYRSITEDNKNLSMCRIQVKEKDREIEGLRKELLATREREKALTLTASQAPLVRQLSPSTLPQLTASTLPQIMPPQSLNMDPLGPKVWKVDCSRVTQGLHTCRHCCNVPATTWNVVMYYLSKVIIQGKIQISIPKIQLSTVFSVKSMC